METSDNEDPTSSGATNYKFEDYDDEVTGPTMALSEIAIIDDDIVNDENEEDSEAEDDIIKKTDNLIIVGHVEEDASILEVYVYNEEEGSLYVHHDFLLPAFPLCIEWLSYDPGNTDSDISNMCAIGSMDPVITIWDLDIQDSLEPALKLGKNSKKHKIGHKEAVLDLSWNRNFSHILASASVDQTVILWDLDTGEPHTTLTSFNEKIQTIAFEPNEAHQLLTGSCDGTIKLFDCRETNDISNCFKTWTLDTEIERVAWNASDTNYFLASTHSGMVHLMDARNEGSTVWSHRCHEEEVSGLNVSSSMKGLLITSSADGLLKVWDFNETEIKLVYTQNLKIGQIQCLQSSPNNPLTVAAGGDFKKKNFKVVDLKHEQVLSTFENRQQ